MTIVVEIKVVLRAVNIVYVSKNNMAKIAVLYVRLTAKKIYVIKNMVTVYMAVKETSTVYDVKTFVLQIANIITVTLSPEYVLMAVKTAGLAIFVTKRAVIIVLIPDATSLRDIAAKDVTIRKHTLVGFAT